MRAEKTNLNEPNAAQRSLPLLDYQMPSPLGERQGEAGPGLGPYPRATGVEFCQTIFDQYPEDSPLRFKKSILKYQPGF